VNRREFSQRLTISVLGAGILGSGTVKATKPRVASKSEKKQWAVEHLKGMENMLLPSFSPDFKNLDEDGIRHDVRQSIRHGFCACTISASMGITSEHRRRLIEIARAESGNKIMISVTVGGTEESVIEALAHAEKTGCSHALVMFPDDLQPQSEEEVYAHFRKIIDSTSLGIVLYGTDVPALRRFHPSGILVNVFDRLADVPNVIGVKLTHVMNVATAYELCERLSDRLILGPVNLDLVPVLAKNYRNIQWSGQWIVESVQSPAKPYAVELMRLVREGRFNDALKVYWQMQPLIQAIYDLQAPLLLHGSHPWAHMKYYQWCVGGNGGLLPLKASQYLPILDAKGRERIRDNYRKVDIATVDSPEEEFVVGKMNYARGVRPGNLSSTPLYG
jgi:4-hydroxy-tetrahydrodipicolinate synthase